MAEGHASVKTYWQIFVVLFVATAIEWAVYLVPSWRESAAFMLPVMGGLSLVKFVLVVGWYMHLKFDNKILTWCFVFSALLALMVFVILHLAM